ncbi:hypothetical protein N7462_010099 [Penicillium macrosclerotiorum]|uniref:uncharacterized protein n=1 Tax=Penicillium macrosclerotiorum TaxID=303699 RepID=UPI00254996EB|nr:uncharacterized protein N7462_010099 [Penicillium macrosclerotiorum]KAJ5669029.1 hypothetical protein N7462_010099 [Penicillium macrosclerotiorum]
MLDSNVLVQWPGWSTVLCVSFLSSLLLFLASLRKSQKRSPPVPTTHPYVDEPTFYPPVEPLPDFNWEDTTPVKIRPFKSKYNLTMSIQEATASELIEMDKNYLDRITLRKRIMAENPGLTLAAEEVVKPAVDEFYIWLVGTYLPTRYPRILVTGEKYPLTPATQPIETLQSLGGLVEDDLLFLMPSEDGDSVKLKGFVTCFPSGFETPKKLNLKLRDIHGPVPHYKEKIEKSMDRFFDRLKVGRFVKRANVSRNVVAVQSLSTRLMLTDFTSKWSIQNTDQLCVPSGNHLYEGEKMQNENFNIDIKQARFRVERQFLHRLPQSRALLFSFKTLLYPLTEIKEEGLGEALAEAINGLRDGNAPGFYKYKRAAVWGDSAKEFLCS